MTRQSAIRALVRAHDPAARAALTRFYAYGPNAQIPADVLRAGLRVEASIHRATAALAAMGYEWRRDADGTIATSIIGASPREARLR